MKQCNFKSDTFCRLQKMDMRGGFLTAISNYHTCCGEDECVLYLIYKHLYIEKGPLMNLCNERKHD